MTTPDAALQARLEAIEAVPLHAQGASHDAEWVDTLAEMTGSHEQACWLLAQSLLEEELGLVVPADPRACALALRRALRGSVPSLQPVKAVV